MGEAWIMKPTKTDRVHFILIEDEASKLQRLTASLAEGGFAECSSGAAVSGRYFTREDYVLALNTAGSQSEKSVVVGMVIPNLSVRKKYFRCSVLFLVTAVLWMVVAGAIIVGHGLGFVLAIAGYPGLLQLFIPVLPMIYNIFWIVSAVAFVFIGYTQVWFPIYNASMAGRGLAGLAPAVRKALPDVRINEFAVGAGWRNMSINRGIPDSFRQPLEAGFTTTNVMRSLDDIAYMLVLPC